MPRGRPPSAKTLVDRQLGRNIIHPVLPADDFIVPNHSGDHSAGTTGTPVNELDMVNKAYVDTTTIPIEYKNETGSAGYYLGGALTAGAGCTFDITAGEGYIRTTAFSLASLNKITWGASTAVAVADNTTTYVFMDDTGSLVTNTDEFVESEDLIMIGMVTCESASIVSVFNLGVRLDESIGQAGRYIRRVHSIIRDARKGGLMLGETGTRNITLSSGVLWWGRTEYDITSKDTSASDTFDTYSSSGREATGATAWPNTQYDNAGTLTTMTNNRWGTLWFYIEPNDKIVMLYGTEQFVSESQAEVAEQPGVRGNRILNGSILAARIIFQKSAATAEQIESAFEVLFSTTGISDHVNLANIGTNTHPQIDTHLALTNEHIDWTSTSEDFNTSGSVDTGDIKVNGMFNLSSATGLTISSGAITITKSHHFVDTESSASTDNLDNVNGGTDGQVIVLRQASSARDVTLRNVGGGSGNLRLAGNNDFMLSNTQSTIMLIKTSANWLEISRSLN